jgi:serine racemase
VSAESDPVSEVTPVHTCSTLDALVSSGDVDVELYFKCEMFQKGGAFKFRGAINSILSLSDAEAAKGVVTHSSGNHAGALALAAQVKGIPSYIVVPEARGRGGGSLPSSTREPSHIDVTVESIMRQVIQS